ncbi:MAG: tetratricopeptide repeat protein, partial [Solirubrobacteraceae bacterium]
TEAVLGAGHGGDVTTEADCRVPLIAAARGDAAELERWLARPRPATEWREVGLMEACARAVALRATGRLDEAAALLEPALPEITRTATISIALYLGDIVDTILEAELHELLEQLVGHLTRVRVALTRGEQLRGQGLLAARRQQLPEAEPLLAQAVSVLRTVGNPYALSRSLLDHGSLLVDAGRPDEAATLLREARTLFEGLRASPWLARVEGALAPLAPA